MHTWSSVFWSIRNHKQDKQLHRLVQYADPRQNTLNNYISASNFVFKFQRDFTVAMHMGKFVLHWWQDNSIICKLKSQMGHAFVSFWYESSASLIPFGAFRTIASIFFAYFWSIWLRFSDRISIDAYEKAAFWNPTRWHSITVEVNIGTVSATNKMSWHSMKYYFEVSFPLPLRAGNLEILAATWINSLAAWWWSPIFTCVRTKVYRCNSAKFPTITALIDRLFLRSSWKWSFRQYQWVKLECGRVNCLLWYTHLIHRKE